MNIAPDSREQLENMAKTTLAHPTDAMIRLALTHAYQLGKIDGAIAGADNLLAAVRRPVVEAV